jgi:hypothetical protein
VTVTEKLTEQVEMPSFARRGHPSADSDMRLQTGYHIFLGKFHPPMEMLPQAATPTHKRFL